MNWNELIEFNKRQENSVDEHELHIQKQIAVGLLISERKDMTDEFIADFTGLPIEFIQEERREIDESGSQG